MESRARLSELAQQFLVERPKELERPSGFGKPQHGAVRRPNVCADVRVGLDEQRLGQLFPAQSRGGLLRSSCTQSGHRRALWASWKLADAALVGRSDRPTLARARGGNAAV